MSAVNPLVVASDDARRTISEFNGTHYAVQHFVMHEALPVGKHYHRGKDEHFYFLRGGGEYRWYPVDETGAPLGSVQATTIFAGDEVYVPAYTAHMFVLEPGTEMVCYSTAPFDADDLNKVDLFD